MDDDDPHGLVPSLGRRLRHGHTLTLAAPGPAGTARLRQVEVDLVAVKVRVECRAVGVVHADRALALRARTIR